MVTEATVQIDGFDELAYKIQEFRLVISDFRPLFALLANDFYKDEKRIFKLKGKGQYQDLTEPYKIQKLKKHGFVYPILKATGALEASLTNPSDGNAILIRKKENMLIGTSVPYAVYHHSLAARKKMPRRPLWFIEPTQPTGKRWADTTDAYLEKTLQERMNNPRRDKRTF